MEGGREDGKQLRVVGEEQGEAEQRDDDRRLDLLPHQPHLLHDVIPSPLECSGSSAIDDTVPMISLRRRRKGKEEIGNGRRGK